MKSVDKNIGLKLNELLNDPNLIEPHNILGVLVTILSVAEDECMESIEEIDYDTANDISVLRGELEELMDD